MANVSPNFPNSTGWVDKVNGTDDVDATHVNQLYAEVEAIRTGVLKNTPNIQSVDDTGIADNEIAIFDLTNKKIKTSDKTISTTLDSTGNTIPTGKAITDKYNVANGIAGLDSNSRIPLAQIPTEITNQIVKKYGARRAIGASSSTLERVWNASGLVANVGVDSATVTNNFDNIYPWSEIKECNIEVLAGEVVVRAYKGEPSFTRDGTNGNVAIEIPIFYQAPQLPGDGYEYWGVSEYPIGGWNLSPAFIGTNGQLLRKTYIAKYTTGMDVLKVTGVSTTSGSPNITFDTNTNIKVGDVIRGMNIPLGSTISSCTSTTAVLNNNCTGTSSGLKCTIPLTLAGGSNTNGSAIISFTSSSILKVGDVLSGSGITANSTVISLNGTTQATLDKNCTGGTGIFTILRPVSQTDLPCEVNRSRTSFRSICGNYSVNKMHLMDMADHDIISTLFTVEYNTLNSQSIMQGVNGLPYTATHRPIIAENNVNRVVLASYFADQYVVGCSMDIGTTQGGREVAKDRKITAINSVSNLTLTGGTFAQYSNQYSGFFTSDTSSIKVGMTISNSSYIPSGTTVVAFDGFNVITMSNTATSSGVGKDATISSKELVFDGPPTNTTTSQYVYAVGWYSGATDSVTSPSGSLTSNTSAKYPMKYRGIGNLWGNINQWLDGININASYTSTSPSGITLIGGSSTSGSNVLNVASTTGVKEGYAITGTGIPTNTVVTTVVSSTQLYISNNATSSNTNQSYTVTSSLAYVTTNPVNYTDDIFSGYYKPLNYELSNVEGYPRSMGYDNRNPFVRLPFNMCTMSPTVVNMTIGSSTIDLSSTNGINIGSSVSGSGIPSNSTVLSIISSTRIVISQNVSENRTSGIITFTNAGSSTQYLSDYYYRSSGNRALLFGGHWYYGANSGLWFFIASVAASYTSVSCGSRLSWKP